MQRLIVTLCKSNVLRTSSRSGSLFGSTHRNVEKKSQTNTGIFFREYSKIPVNDLRVGMVHVDAKGRLLEVTKAQHHRTGMRAAYMHAELKDLKTGSKVIERFRTSEVLEIADMDTKQLKYVGRSGDKFEFTDADTFETVELSSDFVGVAQHYIKEGFEAQIRSFEEAPLSIRWLTQTAAITVADTPPWTKGDNAKARHKQATLANGRKIKVPVFIETGDRISVNINDESYVGREGEEAKEEVDEDEEDEDEDDNEKK